MVCSIIRRVDPRKLLCHAGRFFTISCFAQRKMASKCRVEKFTRVKVLSFTHAICFWGYRRDKIDGPGQKRITRGVKVNPSTGIEKFASSLLPAVCSQFLRSHLLSLLHALVTDGKGPPNHWFTSPGIQTCVELRSPPEWF